jgi:3-oxoacyl-(acyl-carrier-protein) synthase
VKNEVAITGVGLISPWGERIEDIVSALNKTEKSDGDKPVVMKTIGQFDSVQKLGRKGLRQMNRSAMFSVYAALQCLSDSNLDASLASDELGVVLGTQFGHLDRMEQMMKVIRDEGARSLNPTDAGYGGLNVLASIIGVRTNAKAVNATINNGCASGLDAALYACGMITGGHAKYVLAGGVETTSKYYLEWLRANQNDRAYEGAGFIQLEKPDTAERRGIKPYAVIRAFASLPYVGADCVTKSMNKALMSASISAEEIDLFIGGDKCSYKYENSKFQPKRKIFIKDILGEGMAVSGIYQLLIALRFLKDDYRNALIHLCGQGENSLSVILTNSAAMTR